MLTRGVTGEAVADDLAREHIVNHLSAEKRADAGPAPPPAAPAGAAAPAPAGAPPSGGRPAPSPASSPLTAIAINVFATT